MILYALQTQKNEIKTVEMLSKIKKFVTYISLYLNQANWPNS